MDADRIVGWRDGVDPYELVADALPTTGPGRRGRPDLGLPRAPAAARGAGARVRGRVPDDRPSPLGEGRRRACRAPTRGPGRRRDLPGDLRHGVPGASRGGGRRRPGRAARHQRACPRGLHHRGERPELRVAAPRARRPHDPSTRRRGARLRWRAGRLLLGHHPHGGGGGAARRLRRGIRDRARGSGRGRPCRSTGGDRPGDRSGRATRSSTMRATASDSSTGPGTGSAWRFTSPRTSSKGTRRCSSRG